MRIAKNDIPVKVEAPGAVARQTGGFGDATGCGTMAGEHFRLETGTDLAPLLQGLEGDLCQAPHWGYVIAGRLTVGYADGSEERLQEGDLFHLPPGHTARVERAAEFVLFSPRDEHAAVLDHISGKLAG